MSNRVIPTPVTYVLAQSARRSQRTAPKVLCVLCVLCVSTYVIRVTVVATSNPAATSSVHQVFRSAVDGVIIPVSVTSGNKPVADLTAADFELRDNGVVQELQRVDSEKVPLDITLLLDLSSSVDGPLLRRLKTAVSDTAGLLKRDDRIRLVAISQVLHEVFGLQPRGEGLSLETLTAEGATSLYDGIAATMMRPPEAGRRQLVVAFTDGRDSTSIIDASTAAEIARLSEPVVDVVVPADPQTQDPGARRFSQRPGGVSSVMGDNVVAGRTGPGVRAPDDLAMVALTAVVRPTGGQVFLLDTTGSISRAFKTMLESFRASYVLRYTPRNVAPEGWHEIGVTVTRHGHYEIRNRKGYQGRATISPGGLR
jgi:VWFA-related protein